MNNIEIKGKNYTNLERITGGSNCDAFLVSTDGGSDIKLVIKVFGKDLIPVALANELIEDLYLCNKILYKTNQNISTFYDITKKSFSNNEQCSIVIVEKYKGISLREFVRRIGDVDLKKLNKLKKNAIGFIEKLPENIPLDTNPGNFVIDTDSTISYIDFVPTYPWKYSQFSKEFTILKRIYPSFSFDHFNLNKIDSYHKISARIKRFNYYFDLHTKHI